MYAVVKVWHKFGKWPRAGCDCRCVCLSWYIAIFLFYTIYLNISTVIEVSPTVKPYNAQAASYPPVDLTLDVSLVEKNWILSVCYFQSSNKSCDLFLHCRCSCMTHMTTPTRLCPWTATKQSTSHLELKQVCYHRDAGNTDCFDQCVDPRSEVLFCSRVLVVENKAVAATDDTKVVPLAQ